MDDNPLLASMGVDASPMQSYIMKFYDTHIQAGQIISDIDKQDILAYTELVVYKAVTDYVKKLSEIDASGGGSAGSL